MPDRHIQTINLFESVVPEDQRSQEGHSRYRSAMSIHPSFGSYFLFAVSLLRTAVNCLFYGPPFRPPSEPKTENRRIQIRIHSRMNSDYRRVLVDDSSSFHILRSEIDSRVYYESYSPLQPAVPVRIPKVSQSAGKPPTGRRKSSRSFQNCT
jgi:hypothetical protein